MRAVTACSVESTAASAAPAASRAARIRLPRWPKSHSVQLAVRLPWTSELSNGGSCAPGPVGKPCSGKTSIGFSNWVSEPSSATRGNSAERDSPRSAAACSRAARAAATWG